MTVARNLDACPTCFRPLPLVVGPVVAHLDRSIATTRDGRNLALNPSEFALFATLVRAQGVVVGRELLSQAVLGRPWRPEDRCLDQLVLKLRRKLPLDEDGLPLVRTVHGEGFWMRPPADRAVPARANGCASAANGEAVSAVSLALQGASARVIREANSL